MGGRRGLSARSGHQPHRPIGDLRLLPYMTADFTVSATQRGLVLSAFSWSYALMQIPAGSLIDGFGERIMVGASACLWSICTGPTFLASGVGTLFGLRLGLGIGEAGAHPACTRGHPNICRHRTAFGYTARRRPPPARPHPGRRPAEPRTGQQRPAPRSGHRRTGLLSPERPEPRRGGGCADDPRRRGRGPLGLIRMRLARAQGSPPHGRPGRTEPGQARDRPGVRRRRRPGPERRHRGPDQGHRPGGDRRRHHGDRTPRGPDPLPRDPRPGSPRVRVRGIQLRGDAPVRRERHPRQRNEYKIVGASSCRLENFQRIAPMIDSGRLVVKDLIGTQLPLERAADAIRLAASGSDMRVGVDVRARQSTSPTSTSTRPTTPPWPRFATP